MSFSSPHSSPDWQRLPTTPGVYIYKDEAGEILYVGKAKDLKRRVSSYFQPLHTLGLKTAKLVSRISSIEYIDVTSETEALLLEASLIKRFKPFYNIAAKDDKSPFYIHITSEEYPRPIINHQPQASVAGPFLNSSIPRRILRQFRRIAPFCTATRPVKRSCFYSHIGLCHPCPGNNLSSTEKAVYLQNISRLKRLLSGQFVAVQKQLQKDMKHASSINDFETAAIARNQLSALDLLKRVPVTADEYLLNPNLAEDIRTQNIDTLLMHLHPYYPHLLKLSRIEMYDNAHLSGTSPTAAMTVAINGEIEPRQYRHFTIKTSASTSDVDMMKEVLSRRLKRSDWPLPDLLILDGGRPQLSSVLSLVQNIPLISLAKRDEILIIPTRSGFTELKLDRSDPGLRLVQRLRDEAHRFSRRLHHLHRSATIK